jgi:exodeoxyribonuclease VII small subunit
MTDEPTFENDLEALEQIVQELEDGDLPLDASLKKFEEGIRLTKRCEKALTDAEKKIEVLVKNAMGEVEAEPFEAGEQHGAADSQQAARSPRRTRKRSDAGGESADDGEGETDDDGELLF